MNVNNYESPVERPQDMLPEIFRYQHRLAVKYVDIERSNGLLQTADMPINLNDNKGQARIKDMFWRCTEEIAESLEAMDEKDWTHFYEELADAMHFLVEACLLADYHPYPLSPKDSLEYLFDTSKVNQPPNTDCIATELVELHVTSFVKAAGLACNCLKNKPWKQSHMVTDADKFYKKLDKAFKAFITLCKVSGFSAEGLYNMYMRKNQVNQFRQRSGY